jgi:hypothetical protein
MPLDPNTLLDQAKCFECWTEEQRAVASLFLLCQIQSGGQALGNVRATESNDVRVTEAGDIRVIE